MFSNFNFFVRENSFFFLIFLVACGQEPYIFPSTLDGKDSSFFQIRREKDPDRKKILEQSNQVYHGGGLCVSDSSCMKICDQLFFLDLDKKDCYQLPRPQVDQFEKLYSYLLERKKSSLEKIDPFDLRVFLNVSPLPFLKILKTLGPVSARTFLIWLLEDWRVAEVFYKEDFDFLFLDIFLNEIGISPIDSLKEKISENRTFFELSWIKQNDPALFWLSSYFKENRCSHFEGKNSESCVLGQYCQMGSSFRKDFKEEIMNFEDLKSLLDKKGNYPREDLEAFCSAFCSAEKDQEYC